MSLDPHVTLAIRQSVARADFIANQPQLEPPFPYTILPFPFDDYGLGPETIKTKAGAASAADTTAAANNSAY